MPAASSTTTPPSWRFVATDTGVADRGQLAGVAADGLEASNLTVVPWCESCDRYFTPTSVETEGACPTCGDQLESAPDTDHAPPKTPWHFWAGVVAAGGYLIWRAFEGVLSIL